jgi:hypothetical protein
MKTATKMTLVALASGAVFGLMVTTASAGIVCNKDGDCWHVKKNLDYRPEFGLVIHPDDWKWKEGEHNKWREHKGDEQGYWMGNDWKTF